MKSLMLLITTIVLFTTVAFASNVSYLDYTVVATQPTTQAFTTEVSSTPITIANMYVCDTSGKTMIVAAGAVGSEVPLFLAPVSACANFAVNPYLVAGTRLSVKTQGTQTTNVPTTGYNSISLLP
jgi:hypothetical protein